MRLLLRDTGTPAAIQHAELHPELPRTAHPQRKANAWVGVGVPRSWIVELWLTAAQRGWG